NLVDVYRAFGGGWDAPEFVVPEKVEGVRIRTELAEHEADLSVADKEADRILLKVDAYVRFNRLAPGSNGMVTEIEVAVADQELFQDLLPGERVRVSWTEVQVETDAGVERGVEMDAAERLSPQSP
ncbi:MAG: hypothetical protein ACO3NW_07845, partial [Kiritimatiellia bacterium]